MKKIILTLLLAIMSIAVLSTNTKAETSFRTNHKIHGDVVTIVDETTDLTQPIASITDENYLPSSRIWNGMPSVITAGKNIFVAWQTGGLKEPDDNNLNYVVIAASQDEGKTWIDPLIIIDPIDEKDQVMVPQFYYNAKGELKLLFSGIRCIDFINMNSENLQDIKFSDPYKTGVQNSSFTKPTILEDGSIIYASGTIDTYIIKSTDDGKTFKNVATIYSTAPESSRKFSESIIVKKLDGTLWHIRRLDNAVNGGMEQSFSIDGGETWSVPQGNLPYPFFSPGSRFAMQRLKSGNLLLVTNASGNGYTNRYEMTAYLSTDDGATWPYELLLDKEMSSYPDFTQDENGLIYIAFDADRYGEGGMKICMLTEEDIMAGAFVTEKANQLISIAKCNNEYADIVEIVSGFEINKKYPVGTALKDIVKDFSTTVVVKDSNGKEYSLTGNYRSKDSFDSETPGTYTIYFNTSTPKKLKDSFDLLSFDVIIEGNKKDDNKTTAKEPTPTGGSSSGCKSNIGLSMALLSFGICPLFIALKNKKEENK